MTLDLTLSAWSVSVCDFNQQTELIWWHDYKMRIWFMCKHFHSVTSYLFQSSTHLLHTNQHHDITNWNHELFKIFHSPHRWMSAAELSVRRTFMWAQKRVWFQKLFLCKFTYDGLFAFFSGELTTLQTLVNIEFDDSFFINKFKGQKVWVNIV